MTQNNHLKIVVNKKSPVRSGVFNYYLLKK